jgi:hypothetical protein
MEQVRGCFLLEKDGRLYAAVSGLGFYDFESGIVSKPSAMARQLFGEPFLLGSQPVYWTRTSDSGDDSPGYVFFTGLPTEPDFTVLDAMGPKDGLPLDFVADAGTVLGHWKNGDGGHIYRYWQSRNNADPQTYLKAGNPAQLPANDPLTGEIKKIFPDQRIFIQNRDDNACITDLAMISAKPDSVPQIWTARNTDQGRKILTGNKLLNIGSKGDMTVFDLPLLKPGVVYTDFFLKGDVLTLLWEERRGHLTGLSGFLVIERINLQIK